MAALQSSTLQSSTLSVVGPSPAAAQASEIPSQSARSLASQVGSAAPSLLLYAGQGAVLLLFMPITVIAWLAFALDRRTNPVVDQTRPFAGAH